MTLPRGTRPGPRPLPRRVELHVPARPPDRPGTGACPGRPGRVPQRRPEPPRAHRHAARGHGRAGRGPGNPVRAPASSSGTTPAATAAASAPSATAAAPSGNRRLDVTGHVLAVRLRSHLNLPIGAIGALLGVDPDHHQPRHHPDRRAPRGSRIPLPATAPPPAVTPRTPGELLRIRRRSRQHPHHPGKRAHHARTLQTTPAGTATRPDLITDKPILPKTLPVGSAGCWSDL